MDGIRIFWAGWRVGWGVRCCPGCFLLLRSVLYLFSGLLDVLAQTVSCTAAEAAHRNDCDQKKDETELPNPDPGSCLHGGSLPPGLRRRPWVVHPGTREALFACRGGSPGGGGVHDKNGGEEGRRSVGAEERL